MKAFEFLRDCEVGDSNRTPLPGHVQACKSLVLLAQQRMECRAFKGQGKPGSFNSCLNLSRILRASTSSPPSP